MQSMEQMYDYARKLAAYHPERLLAIMQGRDDSLPQAVAMAALKERQAAERQTQGVQALNQPNAKDQLIAEYGPQADPEESGVAALPAENMEFAQGGIVAFAEGDLVESRRRRSRDPLANYPASTLAVDPMNPRNTLLAIPAQGVEIPNIPAKPYDPRTYTYVPNPRLAMDVQDLPSMAGNQMGGQEAPAPSAQTKATPAPGVKVSGPGVGGAAAPAGGSFSMSASRTSGARESAGGGAKPLSAEDIVSRFYSNMPEAPKYRELPTYENKVQVGTAEQYMAEQDALLKSRGIDSNFMNEAEAKLRAQQERMPEDRKTAMWEAVMQAGLGMAAGKSQYALSNVAEGGLAGLQQYREAMKDLKKDEKERDRALADIRKTQFDIESGKVRNATERVERAQTRYDTAQTNVFNSEVAVANAANQQAGDLFKTRTMAELSKGEAGSRAAVALQGYEIEREKMAMQAQLERERMALQNKIASMRQAGATQDELKPYLLKGMELWGKQNELVPPSARVPFDRWFANTGIPRIVSPNTVVTPPKN